MLELREKRLFLKSLTLDGIGEFYLENTARAIPGPSLAPVPENKTGSGGARENLFQLREQVLQCKKCAELASTRRKVVFGSGNSRAEIMFVGEAPGHDEDLAGLPFVGEAGKLLTKIIAAIGFTREQVFIANVLKCRPPGNRQPRPEEILNCHDYLMKQIEWIRPRILCALGAFAAQTLLKTGEMISRMRGRVFDLPVVFRSEPSRRVRVICTYHPAYLLRNPDDKRKVWDDMKMLLKELEGLRSREPRD
ncbi:MAG: uracil-DNA glycosylase [Candidatus Omnitrophota bacterium]